MQSYVLMLQTDEDDQYITETTLSEMNITVPVKFIRSVNEINPLINVHGLPSVILINDRGAVHSGNQILKDLKSQKEFSHIPFVLLGEVTTPEYIKDCYRIGANTYIIKPSTVSATRKKIETFFNYWSEVAEV